MTTSPWMRRFRRLNAGTLSFARFDAIMARARRMKSIWESSDA